MLWQKAKALGQRPSTLLGVENDYVAYCLDEAVVYFGMSLENMLESAGRKPSKEERRATQARERLIEKIFDEGKEKTKGSGFADPATMFS